MSKQIFCNNQIFIGLSWNIHESNKIKQFGHVNIFQMGIPILDFVGNLVTDVLDACIGVRNNNL